MHLREFGILQHHFHKDIVNATYCNVPPGSEIGFKERALSIVDFLGALSILGAGKFPIINYIVHSISDKPL